jgi:hypothetical protein
VPHKDQKGMSKPEISGQVKGRMETIGRCRYNKVLVPLDIIGLKKLGQA